MISFLIAVGFSFSVDPVTRILVGFPCRLLHHDSFYRGLLAAAMTVALLNPVTRIPLAIDPSSIAVDFWSTIFLSTLHDSFLLLWTSIE